MDGAIEWWYSCRRFGGVGECLAKKVVSTGAASGFGSTEIRAIGVNIKNHIAGVVTDDSQGVSGCIVEE